MPAKSLSLKCLWLLPLLLIDGSAALAQQNGTRQTTQAVDTREQSSEQQDSTRQDSKPLANYEALAKPWGLTAAEWERFEALKTQPRGYWSPQLDPLTALGMEAQSEAERTRYAELQVRLEVARVERELAYQRAYDAAFKRLYPKLLPVKDNAGSFDAVLKNGFKAAALNPAVPAPEGRFLLFVADGCAPCLATLHRLQAQNASFDVQMLGTQGDDSLVQRWARQAGIPPQAVQQQTITLNHGEALWQDGGFKQAAAGQIPALFVHREGTWQRVD